MTEQQEFDETYITSSEICESLGIHRVTVLQAVRTDRLPPPIMLRRPNGVPQMMLWKRDGLAPTLAAWKTSLEAKRA